MKITQDAPLAAKTTLGLGGPARRLVRAEIVAHLHDALAMADAANERVLVIGGGSNLVVRDGGWDGVAIEMALPGVHIVREDGQALVTAAAGVVWDELVAETVESQLAGLECLSGIPGLVGATPMQNVGAYGQEVADTITHVRVLDRETDELVTLTPAACGFAYRTSVFKGSERWIVIEVQFRLAIDELGQPLRYPELARSLGVADGARVPLHEVRARVIELRRAKGMVVDPQDPASRSAGSFFTNPIIDAATLAAVEARLPAGVAMPRFPAAGGMTKLSAGWLIERAGFTKGYVRGRAGISTKHALALVNRGGATTRELLELANEIQNGVRDRLGVELVPEPVIVGVD
jgi:UDP-N-acetylmuramate dehydrogenase